tara:strand:+ start:209 stop:319 length:111 start_codon:yes stop_codon:yes gene_type:complete
MKITDEIKNLENKHQEAINSMTYKTSRTSVFGVFFI